MNLLWVGLGGFAGAVTRYGVHNFMRSWEFPAGVLLVNIIGCFFAGVLMSMGDRFGTPMVLFLSVGFLGALTTFSAFSTDTIRLLETRPTFALINIFSVFACIASAYTGKLLAFRFFG